MPLFASMYDTRYKHDDYYFKLYLICLIKPLLLDLKAAYIFLLLYLFGIIIYECEGFLIDNSGSFS